MSTTATLPATHLLRQLLLFALTTVFLLTLVRAVYSLWQFPRLQEAGVLADVFIQGLRFDVALIGLLLFLPLIVGALFGMFSPTRALARVLVTILLMAGLLFVLFSEFITPWFMVEEGVRPDLSVMGAVEKPIEAVGSLISSHPVPLVIAAVLFVLIAIAFWYRLELPRFLRYRLARGGSIALLLIGALVCVVAVWSKPDLRQNLLNPADALISADQTVNEIAMNSGWKILYSLAAPHLGRMVPPG